MINENDKIIKFNNLIFQKINNSWWKVKKYTTENYNTGSRKISISAPILLHEISFNDIKKLYLRMKKINRIING